MLDTHSKESDALCDICGHLSREPPFPRVDIARATYPDFADRATHGCIFCVLICNIIATHSSPWGHIERNKLFVEVNADDDRLTVALYQLFRAYPPDQATWAGNSRKLLSTALYSPLGKRTRNRHIFPMT